MLCLSYLQTVFMSFLQKHREEENGWLVLLQSLFQQGHNLGTLVSCCGPVCTHFDFNIWEVTALIQESFVREIPSLPKQDFDWELFK